ncbi:MAG: glycosyltransferase family 4 protein [Planctomycetota bacterium]
MNPSRMPARPRILFIAPLPPPVTGQAIAGQALLDGLRTTHDAQVIDLMKGHHRQGFTSLNHALKVLGFVWRSWRAAPGRDVIYLSLSQSIAGNLKDCAILWALGRHRERTVLHLHGGGIRRTVYDRSRLLRFLNARLLRSVRRVVVLGASLHAVFEGLVERDRIVSVPNFAANELFLSRQEIAAKVLSDGPLEVLYLSTLFESKGYDVLVDAAERIERVRPGELRLTIAGSFVDEAQERRVRPRLDAIPNIQYCGVLDGDARREALARSHVLCLPTRYPYEGQPLCILEAYASGCAVLTTDQGGIRDIFEPGVNGLEVERTAESVERALLECLDDRVRVAGFARANRDIAEYYTLDAHLERLRDVLS